MIFKILKPTDVNIKSLLVYCGSRVYAEDIQFCADDYLEFDELDDIFNKFPNLKGFSGNNFMHNEPEIFLRIDVETGKVENWPEGVSGNFMNTKVVDEGTYLLIDENGNEISRRETYVPSVLEIEENGYGDYFEFVINKDGYIENWKFTQEHVDELLGVDDED